MSPRRERARNANIRRTCMHVCICLCALCTSTVATPASSITSRAAWHYKPIRPLLILSPGQEANWLPSPWLRSGNYCNCTRRMIDIRNNELLPICHFISLALNPTRASRLHFLHMYAHIRAQMYTLALCNRRRVVWVSPIYIYAHARTSLCGLHVRALHTSKHTHAHAYIQIYTNTYKCLCTYVRLGASSLKYAIKKYPASLW